MLAAHAARSPTTRSGRGCARRAAPSSRRGSRSGRPTISPSSPSAAGIRRYQREIRNGTGYPFFVFSPDGDTLLGGLTLAQIQRGVTQSAVLGYWMGEPYAGKGLMTAAVRP